MAARSGTRRPRAFPSTARSSDGPTQREDRGEHRGWEADRLEDNSRIEVDIRIQPPVYEVLVLKRDSLELLRNLQQRVVLHPEAFEHLLGGLLENSRARVEILVDAMAESHEAEGIVRIFRPPDDIWDAVDAADLPQHLQAGLVCTAMGGAPERRHASGDAGEGVRV